LYVKELTAIQSKIFELGTTLEQLCATSRTAVGGSCMNVTEVQFHSVEYLGVDLLLIRTVHACMLHEVFVLCHVHCVIVCRYFSHFKFLTLRPCHRRSRPKLARSTASVNTPARRRNARQRIDLWWVISVLCQCLLYIDFNCVKLLSANCFYRQSCLQGSSAGIVFTHGLILGFFAPHGQQVAQINVKFGREEQTLTAKFHLDWLRGVGLQLPKLWKFEILPILLPLRGGSRTLFLPNL